LEILLETNMHVCVTGGTGFVGRALVRRLLANGAQVRVLARPSPRADALEAEGAEVVRGDMNDASAIDRAVERAEIVYHTAAMVEGPGNREKFFDANVRATDSVLHASLRAKPRRIVYLSSIAVYGPASPDERIDEDTPLDDLPGERDFYAWSKIEADKLATRFAKNSAVPLTILRPGVIFGSGRPLPTALLGARIGKLDIVFGRRNQPFPLTYIENLIDAMELAAREPENDSRQYIVIDDEKLTLGQYHAARTKLTRTHTAFWAAQPVVVAATITRPALRLVPADTGAFSRRQIVRASQDRHYSARRIREELGWTPRVSLQEAIGRTLRA
jgi:nucleoside-diphosphate-sugar epimerase